MYKHQRTAVESAFHSLLHSHTHTRSGHFHWCISAVFSPFLPLLPPLLVFLIPFFLFFLQFESQLCSVQCHWHKHTKTKWANQMAALYLNIAHFHFASFYCFCCCCCCWVSSEPETIYRTTHLPFFLELRRIFLSGSTHFYGTHFEWVNEWRRPKKKRNCTHLVVAAATLMYGTASNVCSLRAPTNVAK